jgi:hypothetical protein
MFAGELLKKAENLLTMGLHPSEIIAGYEMARDKAEEELKSMSSQPNPLAYDKADPVCIRFEEPHHSFTINGRIPLTPSPFRSGSKTIWQRRVAC